MIIAILIVMFLLASAFALYQASQADMYKHELIIISNEREKYKKDYKRISDYVHQGAEDYHHHKQHVHVLSDAEHISQANEHMCNKLGVLVQSMDNYLIKH